MKEITRTCEVCKVESTGHDSVVNFHINFSRNQGGTLPYARCTDCRESDRHPNDDLSEKYLGDHYETSGVASMLNEWLGAP